MEIPSLCSLICFAGCLRVGGSVGFLVLDELVDDLSDPRTGSESDAWGYRGEVFESQFHHRIHPGGFNNSIIRACLLESMEELRKLGRGKKPQKTAYARLLAKATHALAEGESKPEPKDLWVEPYEGFFISYLKSDIRVVRELPMELQSLDLEEIGSMVTDTDIMKEAKPSFYLNYILPILHLNRVVHFVGFGNRLASDPIPHQL
ncbi:hypothetical protein ACS0TY_032880 [Phlomoides rotata]